MCRNSVATPSKRTRTPPDRRRDRPAAIDRAALAAAPALWSTWNGCAATTPGICWHWTPTRSPYCATAATCWPTRCRSCRRPPYWDRHRSGAQGPPWTLIGMQTRVRRGSAMGQPGGASRGLCRSRVRATVTTTTITSPRPLAGASRFTSHTQSGGQHRSCQPAPGQPRKDLQAIQAPWLAARG